MTVIEVQRVRLEAKQPRCDSMRVLMQEEGKGVREEEAPHSQDRETKIAPARHSADRLKISHALRMSNSFLPYRGRRLGSGL